MSYLDSARLFDDIADHHTEHAASTDWWLQHAQLVTDATADLKQAMQADSAFDLGPITGLRFPFVQMGSISSLELFGLHELIIFAFYWRNRTRYATTADMGANLGLHTVVMRKLGFATTSYEPDPTHLQILRANIERNDCREGHVLEAAVGAVNGQAEFVRVLGNTTGSHLAGAKSDPYGELEHFTVPTIAMSEAVQGIDFVKMDVEGLEADLLSLLSPSVLTHLDVICEVGTPANAQRIFDHFHGTDVRLFSQKANWQAARSVDELPTSHRDGSLFISVLPEMPWS